MFINIIDITFCSEYINFLAHYSAKEQLQTAILTLKEGLEKITITDESLSLFCRLMTQLIQLAPSNSLIDLFAKPSSIFILSIPTQKHSLLELSSEAPDFLLSFLQINSSNLNQNKTQNQNTFK